LNNTTLEEYLLQAGKRLPEKSENVLIALLEDRSSKEDLSLKAQVRRSSLDDIVNRLYTLGFLDIYSEGKSKICKITNLGKSYLKLQIDKVS